MRARARRRAELPAHTRVSAACGRCPRKERATPGSRGGPPGRPAAGRDPTSTVPIGAARGADLAVASSRRTTAVERAKKTSSTAAGPSLADVS